MDERALRYWIGFNRAKGVGPIRLRGLLKYFGDIEIAWNAPAKALQAAGLDQRSLHSLLAVRAACDLDAELRAIEVAEAWIVTLEDELYPPLLRTIDDAPPVLYVKGSLEASDWRALSVVGTRRATTYGKTMARELVELLAQEGIIIVSGLARGIDATAHQAALDTGGRTIAVMANGIDLIYPPENRALAEAIQAHGALISELPLGEPAESTHFAPRNRIVSGMTLGTLVVEAAERSGALMTANFALNQGREVFAVPGNVLSPSSKGANGLIQTGAHVVTSAADILDVLASVPLPMESLENAAKVIPTRPPQRRITPKPPSARAVSVTTPVKTEPVTQTESLILERLSAEPQHVDDLANQSGLPIRQITSTLTLLELKGLVRQTGAMQYALAEPPRIYKPKP